MQDYGLQFNPNQMSLSELTQTPMFNQAMSQMGNGMGSQGMGGAGMMQNFQQGVNQAAQSPMDAMKAMQDQQRQMDAYKMMAQGVQGMGRGMQQQMPSGNTAQIIRDQNQFRFAGNPQQQMAQALRNRG